MKINVLQNIKGYDGADLQENGKDITYRSVFATALNTFLPDENPSADLKAQAFAISNKLFVEGEAELSVTDAALIIERVGKIYSPLVFGRTKELLDSKE